VPRTPQPTLSVTTEYGTLNIYAQMECPNFHLFLAEPGDTTGINCPDCEENRKAAHQQTKLASSNS
jgi:hypothetical protein